MRNFLRSILGQNSQWFCENVFFISWGKHWKGVYIHFLPRYSVRVFLWGVDWRRRRPLSGCSEQRDAGL